MSTQQSDTPHLWTLLEALDALEETEHELEQARLAERLARVQLEEARKERDWQFNYREEGFAKFRAENAASNTRFRNVTTALLALIPQEIQREAKLIIEQLSK
tara:strand:- start:73 stop:381 length:309 start_codon:yes stop_codon:yes gene_type:complete